MLTGGSSPELPAALMPDFIRTNVVDARDLFPREGPAPRTLSLSEKLLDARFQLLHDPATAPETVSHCDEMIARYCALEEQVNQFLAATHQQHVATLERRRAELWSECRRREDTVREYIQQIGGWNRIFATGRWPS